MKGRRLMTTAEIRGSTKDLKSKLSAETSLPSPAPFELSTPMMVTQKTNHVRTVLLYGIPIVSLYIEGQERLCLAQISNTLLKAYSYNEIHNRRVALGITCVQCTPVQLEILRRAGAMPVSSRRCGMITRREAERLCKSFLGDNSPPRLPEDFAFNVQHKCAWGCRGSFLPSRYNSSRAKCIKCSFCGMFFSPNKFIFHSHRMSANDKYVQPDAANFNSWRRHMFLSGQPEEEVVHAWEDVKAMFNGGTRKRLLHSNVNLGCSSMSHTIPPDTETNSSKNESVVQIKRTRKSSACGANGFEEEFSTRSSNNTKVSSNETANAMRSTIIVPQRFQHLQADPNPLTVPSLQMSSLAPQLMVDYMFQQQHHKLKNESNCPPFAFSNCTSLPWLKTPACPSQFKCLNTNEQGSASSPSSFLSQNNYSVPNLLSTSAFKPVLQQSFQRARPTVNTLTTAATFVSSSLYTCSNNAASNHLTQSNANTSFTSCAMASRSPRSRILVPPSLVVRSQTTSSLSVKDQPHSDDDDNTDERLLQKETNEDEDEIEVDIETTEDDLQIQDLKDDLFQNKCLSKFNKSQNHADISASESHVDRKVRCSSCSRQYNSSSSNDSLYMSARTKSEKESSSRATSSSSIEINSDDITNSRPVLQERHPKILKNAISRKILDIDANTQNSKLLKKSENLSTVNLIGITADNPIGPDTPVLHNNAADYFDSLNTNNKSLKTLPNINDHNKTANQYNYELWHVSSLCLHHPQNLNNPSNCIRKCDITQQHEHLGEKIVNSFID